MDALNKIFDIGVIMNKLYKGLDSLAVLEQMTDESFDLVSALVLP